jgi:hypothetical protein
MSTYIYSKMTVRGNTKTLDKFVNYLETEYYDEHVRELIKLNGYKDINCYVVEGTGNYFFIDVERLSNVFPGLKFEYIQECHDGQSGSDYRICLNGKTVDYNEGNSLTFDGKCEEEKERCNLCNCKLAIEPWEFGECDECIDLESALRVMKGLQK